jgi:hypothetical protein
MLTCLLTNWGATVILALLLSFSEFLAKTERFKENGIIDFISYYLRLVLKRDQN